MIRRYFYEMARGLERVPEGGKRCFKCYRLRMEEAANLQKRETTITLRRPCQSVLWKNTEKINEIWGSTGRNLWSKASAI